MTLLSTILTTCSQIQDDRGRFQIFSHVVEEVGELSVEILISEGLSHKKEGKDGVVGEALDAIVCLVDIIHKTNPHLTEEDLIKIAKVKLIKWADSVSLRQSEKSRQ